jgi:hypothetical protein
MAADVLAERQRQRRCKIIVGAGFDDLTQCDELALFVGNLQAHDRLAGDHFHDAYADG